jgi:adenylate cyclase
MERTHEPMTTSDHGSVSNVRHDLLTPINHLLGYSEMMLENCEDLGLHEIAGHLDTIRSISKELMHAIHRVLPSEPVADLDVELAKLKVLMEDPLGRMFEGIDEAAATLAGLDDPAAAGDLGKIRTAALRLRAQVQALGVTPTETPVVGVAPSVAPPKPPKPPKPVKPAVASTLSVRLAQRRPQASASGLILVVDDDASNRDVLCQRLEHEGYSTAAARDGREALRMLAERSFDLVLLDFMMPDMSGSEALEVIKATPETAHIPVIMISAMNDTEVVVSCISQGAEDYLAKPFDPVLLRARVGASLEKKRMRDEEQRKSEQLAEALREAERQKEVAGAMLRNILPDEIAEELLTKGEVDPKYFEDVTIGFTDFVGFTASTEMIAAEDLVVSLHEYFTAFDKIIQRYGLEKLKTIGDSYMFAGGIPARSPSHPVDAVLASFELQRAVEEISQRPGMPVWRMRVGLHTGPVIAGVVGIKKFAFDVWGSTVNFASRMESSGAPGCVNISDQTFTRIRDFIRCEPRGKILTKDKVEADMHFACGILPDLLQGPGGTAPAKFLRRYRIYFQKAPLAFPNFLAT